MQPTWLSIAATCDAPVVAQAELGAGRRRPGSGSGWCAAHARGLASASISTRTSTAPVRVLCSSSRSERDQLVLTQRGVQGRAQRLGGAVGLVRKRNRSALFTAAMVEARSAWPDRISRTPSGAISRASAEERPPRSSPASSCPRRSPRSGAGRHREASASTCRPCGARGGRLDRVAYRRRVRRSASNTRCSSSTSSTRFATSPDPRLPPPAGVAVLKLSTDRTDVVT